MTLQWTAVAIFLYFEIGVLLLLMLPWIRPSMWQKIFRSRLVRGIEAYSHIYSYAFAGILFLLFADAIREVRKYSSSTLEKEALVGSPNADAVVHMRLFRAQRNLYVAGFALFLWLVIRRVISLIQHNAQLMASSEAAMKQAQGASKQARDLMDKQGGDHESEAISNLKDTISNLRKEMEIVENDRDTMKKQAESVKKEYDRLLEEFSELQETHGASKKDD